MKTKDVVVGFLILVLFFGGLSYLKKTKSKPASVTPTNTPSIEERITAKFGGLAIPEDTDRIDLKSVPGKDAIGIATRSYEGGKFVATILADLPEPGNGYFYQAWLGKGPVGNPDVTFISIGKLRVAKGGYIAEFESGRDYSDYKKVLVSLEKTFDAAPEENILEGSY